MRLEFSLLKWSEFNILASLNVENSSKIKIFDIQVLDCNDDNFVNIVHSDLGHCTLFQFITYSTEISTQASPYIEHIPK